MIKIITRVLVSALALALYPVPAFALNGPVHFFGKYGVQTTFYFMLEDGTTTDAYVGTDVVAADSTISKDGGASATTTNAVVTTNSPFFAITLTATNMQATQIMVRINDASAAVFKDQWLLITTKLQLGQADIDATQIGGNTAAMQLQGVGVSPGLIATGGATGNGISAIGGASGGDGVGATSPTAVGINAISSGNNGNGFRAAGNGTGAGIRAVGGATGNGVNALGGVTSGVGLNVAAQAGASSNGAIFAGFGSGTGVSILGGTSGNGLYAEGGATTGSGVYFTATGGNNHGVTIVGTGTGSGIRTIGGADGDGITAVGQGGDGIGFRINAGSALLKTNIFDQQEPTAPTGAPNSANTMAQLSQYMVKRFYNKVTQTSTLQAIFNDASSNTFTTCITSDDGTTQTKGKCQ